MPGIHFVNTEHRSNFGKLLIQFGSYQDREYAAACYVLAHPEIYRKVKWAHTESPFDFLKWRGAAVAIRAGRAAVIQVLDLAE
ncbi:DUF2538 family protein [Paenibacillus sp. S-38]|uniref:DUF2538 family protein n=1 Tax=Paenibacillus sp. S-38 TaxID=3416710 RepID=UPI003CEF544A